MTKYQTQLIFESAENIDEWMTIVRKYGGYDPSAKSFTPLKHVKDIVKQDGNEGIAGVQFLLDNVAAASELGLYSRIDDFISECFATRADFDEFASSLELYSIWWVNERHYSAFYELKGEDYGIRTYPEIGETLLELAE